MFTGQLTYIHNQRVIQFFQGDSSPFHMVTRLGESNEITHFKALKNPQWKYTYAHTHNSQMQTLFLTFGFIFPVEMVFLY